MYTSTALRERSITKVNNTSTKRREWSLITGRGARKKQEGGGAGFYPYKKDWQEDFCHAKKRLMYFLTRELEVLTILIGGGGGGHKKVPPFIRGGAKGFTLF